MKSGDRSRTPRSDLHSLVQLLFGTGLLGGPRNNQVGPFASRPSTQTQVVLPFDICALLATHEARMIHEASGLRPAMQRVCKVAPVAVP